MAFCEFCGKEIPDGQTCDCAEAQANSSASTSYSADTSTPVSPAKAKAKMSKPGSVNPKLIAIIAAAVVIVIAIVVLCITLLGGSYKTPINKFVKYINKGESNPVKYIELFNDPMTTSYQKDMMSLLKKNDDFKDDLNDRIDEVKEWFDDNKGLKLSVEITSANKMKNSDIHDMEDDIEELYDYYEDMIDELKDMDSTDIEDLADDLEISKGAAKKYVNMTIDYYKSFKKVKIQAAYKVKVRFNAKFDGEKDHTDKIELQVVKINGKWYIANEGDLFSGIVFEDDVDLESSFRDLYYILPSSIY